MARQEIDLTTPQPNGKMGEPTKAAWTKVNDMTAEIYASAGMSGFISGKNMLINCGIPINQRGFAGGALAAGVYGYDRWRAGSSGCNISINPSNGLFSHNSGSIEQIVESPLLAWGAPVTLSVDSPTGPISVSIGGATGVIPAGVGRMSVTVTPSGSGNMLVRLTASGVNYSRPQLERGPTATSYDVRFQSNELSLCQWYGEIVTDREFVACAFSASNITGYVQFNSVKRATPSLITIANGSWVGNGASGTITTIVTGNISNRGFRIDPTGFTGSVTQGFSYVIRGAIFFADCELAS